MDQPSTHVHDKESENPKDEENYRDGPKHDGILARSELRLARLTTSRAAAHMNRLRLMLGDSVPDGNEHA
jgi:hypothetical protein